MCYHFSLTATATELSARFGVKVPGPLPPMYHVNAFDHPRLPVITNREPQKIQLYSWGLIPAWVKEEAKALELRDVTPNAVSETAFEKPSFRDAIRKQRCLVPATGFFEWRHEHDQKYPYFIQTSSQSLFAFAGIWSEWANRETGEVVPTFSILTTQANPLIAKIHNSKQRMPLILEPAQEQAWLSNLDEQGIRQLMQPLSEEKLKAYTIAKTITRRDGPSNVPEVLQAQAYPGLEVL
jgi:putative SOS response-associated peptidase YedK